MRRTLLALGFHPAALLLVVAPGAAAQLTNLQPGRNFVSENQFGLNHSQSIDPGDIDNDGDLDVVVANGGDFGLQPDRIFVNLGGLQGGTAGTFAEETSTRLAGAPIDTSRDADLVDYDNDGDLDLMVANHGPSSTGEVSRFYTNNGGQQGGTIGFYAEETDTRWGALVAVPAGQQVFGGNAGPFRDWCADCDFADLDDNGSSDLFFSSYGPSLNGALDSRVFLNDGNGVFNELWPWADPSADTKTHTKDIDLVDLDGDLDIDVFMSSRDTQSRAYMNNLNAGIGPTLFNDITQTALLATGAGQNSSNTYEVESGDVDGDGDFDLWMVNYDPPGANADRILINNGFTAGVGYGFTKKPTWIKGDPVADEQDVDFGDYDNDGDLDAFAANFSAANSIYQSGLAQGLNADTQGLFHNTGVAGAGNLASTFPENPLNYGGGAELDAHWADIDNDGDEDILIANHANQQNRLFRHVLGVPDTHAPSLHIVTQQDDKPNGTSTVIHAQLRDNSGYSLLDFYPTFLKFRVNNGTEQTMQMKAQGSMQFRGVMPAQTDAFIQYHVETEDLAGNAASSAELCFEQGDAPDLGAWADLGFGLAGANGFPVLTGMGTQLGGCPVSIDLTNALPSSPAILFVGLTNTPTAFKGGTLIPVPLLIAVPFTTSAGGTIALPFTWPSGLPGAFSIYYQYGVQDAAAVAGVALSNALQSTTP